ncbi:MAG TPA: FAD-dependent oxidoreductase [Syntrophomonas sp.]|nr:FAD-dependent oxidoreductase [Syntrophomonas sp.]
MDFNKEKIKSSFPHLAEPGQIGRLKLRNRIVMPSMGSGLAELGYPGERIIQYYQKRAAGGAGLIIIEASYIIPVPGLKTGHMSLASDSHQKEWKCLVDTIHKEGAAVGVQLHHPGRETSKALTADLIAVGPSPIPSPVARVVPHELSIEEIEGIKHAFVSAARRAAAAGADLVEVHGGHGYLGSNFLSPQANKRTDQYGGGPKERARFLVEVVRAIKDELGRDFPVSCRYNGSDYVENGLILSDACEVARTLMESGVDVLNISAGVYGSYPATIPPAIEPQGCFVELAHSIKQMVPVPIIAVGRIKTAAMADRIIAENKADFVAVGRAHLADPEWVFKSMTGQAEDIAPCIGCLQGCIDSLSAVQSAGISCLVNPWAGREFQLKLNKTESPARIIVVGGGPAGLNAAWVMAARGHHVILVEEQKEFGGQLNLAAMVPGKEEFREAIRYFSRKVQSAGVEIIEGKRADVDFIKNLNPDKVIVATGARPVTPQISGTESAFAIQAWEALKFGHVEGQRVAVVGGGAVGIETAELLTSLGKDVTVIEMQPYWGKGMGAIWRWYVKNKRDKKEINFKIVTSAKVIRVEPHQIVMENKGQAIILGNIDAIVLAVGARSNNYLGKEIQAQLGIPVQVIGDAKEVRNALEAVREGVQAGLAV